MIAESSIVHLATRRIITAYFTVSKYCSGGILVVDIGWEHGEKESREGETL